MPGDQGAIAVWPVPCPDRYFSEDGARDGGRIGAGAADGVMVAVAVLAPGAEHNVARAQITGDELRERLFMLGQGVVGEAAADPFQAVHRQSEPAQGLDAFLGAEHAQALFRPLLGALMTGAAVGHRDQLQGVSRGGEQLQQTAAGQHFVAGVGGDYHCAGAGREKGLGTDDRDIGQLRGAVPDLLGTAVTDGHGFHGVTSLLHSPSGVRDASAAAAVRAG
ncbi:hypothetical protein D3C84_733280 [compost metagenome]